jgi:hypothetical protein
MLPKMRPVILPMNLRLEFRLWPVPRVPRDVRRTGLSRDSKPLVATVHGFKVRTLVRRNLILTTECRIAAGFGRGKDENRPHFRMTSSRLQIGAPSRREWLKCNRQREFDAECHSPPGKPCCLSASNKTSATQLERFSERASGLNMGMRSQVSGLASSNAFGTPAVSRPNTR